MAAPPRFKRFSREDFAGAPAWFESFMVPLNEVLGGLVGAISGELTRSENLLSREKADITFTTDASGITPELLAVKNGLPGRPKHCWATRLERTDGAEIASAWSLTWKLDQNNAIRLKLQGLDRSAKYRLSIIYE